MNKAKTLFFLTLFTCLLVFVGHLFDRGFKMNMFVYVFFGISVVVNLVSYWFSDKIVLSMYGAKPVSESEAPELYRIVSNLAQKGNIPTPKLYIIPNPSPNAFATGRNPEHAAVAVTQGIMQILNRDEIEAVIAHELSHIKNRDTLLMVVIATLAGLIMMLSDVARFAMIFAGGSRNNDNDGGNVLALLFLMIVAPLAAVLIQLAISRTREYAADEGSAKMTRNPAALANALLKLEQAVKQVPMVNSSPSTAHLFISSPISGKALFSLFRTHPLTADRVTNLRKVGRELGQIF